MYIYYIIHIYTLYIIPMYIYIYSTWRVYLSRSASGCS